MSTLNKFQSSVGGSMNIGSSKLKADKQTQYTKVLLLPSTFAPITRDAALTKATWTALLQADLGSRAYLTPRCDETADLTPANTEYTPKTTGVPEKLNEFGSAFNMIFGKQNEAFYRNFVNLDGVEGKIVLADKNGNVKMFETSDGKLDGINARLEVTKRKLSDGTTYCQFMLKVTILDSNTEKLKAVILQPAELESGAFSFDDLESLYDVAVTLVGSPTASTLTVQVNITSYEVGDQAGQINGLVQTGATLDFLNDGATTNITSATALGSGKYTLGGTFANGDVISLKKPSELTIKAVWGIECVEPLTIAGIV